MVNFVAKGNAHFYLQCCQYWKLSFLFLCISQYAHRQVFWEVHRNFFSSNLRIWNRISYFMKGLQQTKGGREQLNRSLDWDHGRSFAHGASSVQSQKYCWSPQFQGFLTLLSLQNPKIWDWDLTSFGLKINPRTTLTCMPATLRRDHFDKQWKTRFIPVPTFVTR